ncbi:hypothetical protein ACWDA3_17685 [Nonomuraea rubra]
MLALAAGTLQLSSAPATAEGEPVAAEPQPVATEGEPVAGATTLTNDAWTSTSRQLPTTSNWNGGWSLPIGLDESTGELNRSFVRLDLDRFTGTGADITRASLRLNRAEACRGRESGFEFWLTSKINARTTWEREPTWSKLLGSYPDTWSCPPPGYDGYDSFHFDVTAPLREALARGDRRVSFGMRSTDEADPFGRFHLSTHVHVEVSYTTPPPAQPPAIPSSLAVSRLVPAAWTQISRDHPDIPNWSGGIYPTMGRDPDTGDRTRLYFRYEVPDLGDDRALYARLLLRPQSSCQDYERGFALWETERLTAETTWNNKARWIRELGGIPALPHCSTPGPIVIDVTDALLEALAAGRQEITFGLRSRDERDTHGRYVFEPSPELTLHYNRPPGAPAELKTSSRRKQPTPCVSGDERPYLPDLSAIVYATVPDSAGGPVSARWQWETLAGERLDERVTSANYGPATFAQDFGDARVTDGGVYRWRVRGEDPWAAGEWSQWCEYGVDLTRPATTPIVSSATYPPSPQAGGGPGIAGEFTFSSTGDPDVTGYRYSLDWSTWTDVPALPDGTATVTIRPTSAGDKTLVVHSADRAGNFSLNPRMYLFTVKA